MRYPQCTPATLGWFDGGAGFISVYEGACFASLGFEVRAGVSYGWGSFGLAGGSSEVLWRTFAKLARG